MDARAMTTVIAPTIATFPIALQPDLRGWWASQYVNDIEPITQVAFKEAQQYMRSELGQNNENLWIDEKHTVHDVLALLKHAKETYDNKAKSKARKWLVALSTRILHFRTVLDVFAQHHPEYVSLVWGSFKFLFMVVLDSETMTKELSKSICNLAIALPRAEVALMLYPTARMRMAVAHIYAHILRFAQKAVAWYKKSRLTQMVQVIINPWELKFEEDVVAIQEQSLCIEAEASTASRAELRDAHMQVYRLQEQLTQITSILTQTNLTLHNRLLPLQETQTDMMHSVILNQVLSSGPLQQLPVSGKCLEFCMSFRHRRRNNPNYGLPQVTRLSQWASEDRTKILVVQGWDKKLSRDFLVDLVTLIRSLQRPIIFALRFPEYRDQNFTFTNLLQMLVAQALQINERNFGGIRHLLSPARLQDVVGEDEWLKVLNEALRGLPYAFIVLDSDLLNHAVSYDRYVASKNVAAIRRAVTSTILKIFVSSFSIDTSTFDFSLKDNDWEVFEAGASIRKRAKRSNIEATRLMKRRYKPRV